MTAFGPFAGTVEVDFDELSASGLFLLTGATGAGKTSVLDAVCFALYGQVPGDRAGARHLRSDHAPAGTAPSVTLRVSIGDRTFRFSRSPAWSRPKQRGRGETRVPAHVVVEEWRDDVWHPLTNRLDDAGLFVGDLLGMTATQFTQVAMLPQGRFQAFLRASSTERHAVLQRLFRTDRFELVERWLVDRRGDARRAAEVGERGVLDVLHRFQEAAGADLPAGTALEVVVESGELVTWADALVATARERRNDTRAARGAADAGALTTEATLAEVRGLHDLRRRAETAADELVDLASRSDELASLRDRLAAHRRATPLSALVERSAACRRTAERAQAQWRRMRSELDLTSDDESAERLGGRHSEAVAAHAVAVAFRPRADELRTLDERRAAVAARATELTEGLSRLDAEVAGHPAALDAARASLDEAQAAVAQLPALGRDVDALQDLLDAALRLDIVTEELSAVQIDVAAAHDAALAAKEHYLGVREARINGMAAELAGALAVGCACPVCGSASHPAPASSGKVAIGRAEEEAARKVTEDLGFAHQGLEVRAAGLGAERATLVARLDGVDRSALPTRVAEARARRAAAVELSGVRDERAARLADVQHRVAAAVEARGKAAAELAAARQQAESLGASTAALAGELAALLDDRAPDLETLIARREARCGQLQAAILAFGAYDEAARAAAEADDAVTSAAHARGFPHREAAEAALLTLEQLETIEDELTTADARRLAAEQVLAHPAVRDAAAAVLPDLDVAVVRHRQAVEAAQAAGSADDAAGARLTRLEALQVRLLDALDVWSPLREAHAVVASLSQLVEGKGPDNPLRIRLAAYVLSERLRQVIAAANERLARMTGGRYALEHTDDRGAGEQRGGLSLRVRDDWNGIARDPATLSGGETFVVSLALALGLADTVAHEAGGTDIDTLFVDEGFGSLDTDTLEDVMDTLDALRDGGRVVGLVSHVPELRSRITTQLEVAKGRTGSTLRSVLTSG